MSLDRKLALTVWETIHSLLPEGSVWALAVVLKKDGAVISNIEGDADVEAFLRFSADRHEEDAEKKS